ncbi:cation-translocating P-type ATPase [Mariniblastus fucicola]|uniref:Calcium-transporting ATPase n=1 Tax=Mariniblastus fucicola TaxID=980251 RepID=A0A5B9PDH9_9BACT|nr:cation-translocating P-type ATPase [Mariniblastus fucicola]QEG22636.1 Calcium-transporting ATPase [Mariniblastus fucicola]
MSQLPPNSELSAAYAAPAQQVVDRLGSSVESGLAESSIEQRRTQYGWNELAKAQPEPTWKKLLSQFKELVIWILIVAAILAGAMGEWVDTLAIMAIVVVNGILGFVQEERAGRALAALRAMSSPMAKTRRGGTVHSIPAKELVPGDIIQLDAGDNVPADARLIESFAVSVQEASLTGESVPGSKDAEAVLAEDTPLGDRENSVFMGTVLANGKATAVVTATGMQTELGNIAGMLGAADNEPTPLQRRLAELGRILVVVCLVLVGIIFAIEYARGGELLETLLVAVSLAVAAVPEGLPAVVTIALALGLQRMVKRNALVRKLPSVETLGSVTVICSDKTGTLTRNEMTVRELNVGEGKFKISGAGYLPRGEFQPIDRADTSVDPQDHPDLQQALAVAAHCNSASVVPGKHGKTWQVIGDPTEGALIVMAMKGGFDLDGASRRVVFEIPFDSDRKAMSVIMKQPDDSRIMYTKGAPEVILSKCTQELRNGQIAALTETRRQEIQQQNSDMAGRALRVLALAFRHDPQQVGEQYQESELIYVGSVGMIDPPREEVKSAVAECHGAGVRPVMITGDHPETALAIGRELAIASADCLAVTGADLDRMSKEELEQKVDQIAVYARVSAAHKLRVVNAWKQRGQVVAMTGDGVNDAPAIKAADIGIAMGVTGTDVTKEAADMVLTDDNFTSIVNAVREGRGIFDNIQKFVHYLLSCNAGEVMLMFAAAIIGFPVPLLAIQILWINLVTDGLPALALAMEPPEPDIMKRKPRPPKEPVITVQRGLLIFYHGFLIAAAALFGFWWAYENDPANTDVARSTAFAITAFAQLAYALVCRSHRYTLPELGPFSNPWLFAAFLVSGLLQLAVLTLPFASGVFDVVPLHTMPWIVVAILSLLPATVIELTKIAWHLMGINENTQTGKEKLIPNGNQ